MRRRLVGGALRRYRENMGYALEDAARVLECDRSKISRIETGQRGIRPKELRELLTEYGVPDSEQAALVGLARRRDSRGWWDQYANVLPEAFADYLAMESTAAEIFARNASGAQVAALVDANKTPSGLSKGREASTSLS